MHTKWALCRVVPAETSASPPVWPCSSWSSAALASLSPASVVRLRAYERSQACYPVEAVHVHDADLQSFLNSCSAGEQNDQTCLQKERMLRSKKGWRVPNRVSHASRIRQECKHAAVSGAGSGTSGRGQPTDRSSWTQHRARNEEHVKNTKRKKLSLL